MIDLILGTEQSTAGLATGLSGWRAAALALCAGAALVAASSPARALDTDWHQACTFKSAPQGYGDMAKERACIRQNDCAAMADARGGPMMGMGCMFVQPSVQTPAAGATREQRTQRH